MGTSQWMSSFALAILAAPTMFGAGGITPPNVTVGENLEVIANVALADAAPENGFTITLTSSDPGRVMFSKTPSETGTGSLQLKVRAGYRDSPDFYIQGFAKSGTVKYTASVPGLGDASGVVTLAPSGVILARSGMGVQQLLTTTGSAKTPLLVYTALLDSDMNFVYPQPVAGGKSVSVTLTSSNAQVGTTLPAAVTFAGGTAGVDVEFRPLTAGQTTLSVSVPPGFSAPAQFASVAATVLVPGMAVTDEISIGYNLQTGGSLHLGEPAPAGGVVVTLTSSDPAKLLLSRTPDQVGSDCITIAIPAGGVGGAYFIQALAGSGEVTYTATAPGFRTRTGTVTLTPSGLVMGGPQGPPDEAELINKEIAEGPHGFVTNLSERAGTIVTVYTVQLDPKTHRGADLTVQPVRAGVSIKALLSNSNPAAGKVKVSEMTIAGGVSAVSTHFIPDGAGTSEIAVATPPGHMKAGNSTSLTVIVKQ
jgi:hypothetical protein